MGKALNWISSDNGPVLMRWSSSKQAHTSNSLEVLQNCMFGFWHVHCGLGLGGDTRDLELFSYSTVLGSCKTFLYEAMLIP